MESQLAATLAGQAKPNVPNLSNNWSATCYHFQHEEEMVQRLSYPSYRQHRREHEGLRTQVRARQECAAVGEATMTIEMMRFLMG